MLKFIFTWPHLFFIVFLPPKVPWFWRSLWFYHSKMHIFPEVFLRKMNVLTVTSWKVEMNDADNRVEKPWSTKVFGAFVWKHGGQCFLINCILWRNECVTMCSPYHVVSYVSHRQYQANFTSSASVSASASTSASSSWSSSPSSSSSSSSSWS